MLKIKQIVVYLIFVYLCLNTKIIKAQIYIPIIVQEALPIGESGVDRFSEPFSVGLPLPDNAGITNISQLGLSGTNRGQFRALGWWPSGHIKWVLVDGLTDVPADGLTSSIALISGNGNFGGNDLAKDEGNFISINTGVAQFEIRKSNFNLFDKVIVNGKILVNSGNSQGVILTGPPPSNTIFTSKNDANSEVIIEENGSVKAVIKAMGYHKDSDGNPYMAYTIRMFFYYDKSYVRVKSYLRNANLDPKSCQEFEAYDLQVSINSSQSKNFEIATNSDIVKGNFKSGEDVYLYQKYSNYKEPNVWRSYYVKSYIPRIDIGGQNFVYDEEGYEIRQGGNIIASGGKDNYPEGWANINNDDSTGLMIGSYYLAGYWPKSLEFNNGGADVRIGLWPNQNAITYWQAYPQYSIHENLFYFHTSSIEYAKEFKKFQNFLIARSGREAYNNAQVFPDPLISIEEEDNYFSSIDIDGIPCWDHNNADIFIWRFYGWGDTGGANQTDFRYENLIKWIRQGTSGHYLYSKLFFNFLEENAIPRCDSFKWREQPSNQWDWAGEPAVSIIANNEKAHVAHLDGSHAHWKGIVWYYFLSGDEGIKEAILDFKDRWCNTESYMGKVGAATTRGLGCSLMGYAAMYYFLDTIQDNEKDVVLQLAENQLNIRIFPELQLSGFGNNPQGISRTRGVPYAGGTYQNERVAQGYVGTGHLTEGLWDYYQLRGDFTPNAELLKELFLGIADWERNEMWFEDDILKTGFAYLIYLDQPNDPLSGTYGHDVGRMMWWAYELTGDSNWIHIIDKFCQMTEYRQLDSQLNLSTIHRCIESRMNQESIQKKLYIQDIKVTRNLDNSYTLSWIIPENVLDYQIKYAEKPIVEWLNFDNQTNSFEIDPNNFIPYFAANNISNDPIPGIPGTSQEFTIKNLDSANNYYFSMKYFTHKTIMYPIVYDVKPDTIFNSLNGINIRGINFSNNLDSINIELCDNNVYDLATIKIIQAIESISDTSIKFTCIGDSLKSRIVYLFVNNEKGFRNISGFPLYLKSFSTIQEGSKVNMPNNFFLAQNYPNPFNDTTVIIYGIPSSDVNRNFSSEILTILRIFNNRGQTVKTLVNEKKKPGFHQITWDGKDASGNKVTSGVYFYWINAGDFSANKKLIFIK